MEDVDLMVEDGGCDVEGKGYYVIVLVGDECG